MANSDIPEKKQNAESTKSAEIPFTKEINELKNLFVGTHPVWHYSKKGIRLILEFASYFVFVIILFGAILLPLNPLGSGRYQASDSVIILYGLELRELTELMLFFKIIMFLFAFGVLGIGFLFRSIRKKNDVAKQAADILQIIKT